MTTIRRFAILALLLSAASFMTHIYFGSDENWCPVHLPFPGRGLEVAWPFRIVTAGNFRLEVSLPSQIDPSNSTSLPAKTSVLCDLLLEIKSPEGTVIRQSIKQVNHFGGYPFGHLDDYKAESLLLPKSGAYTFRLQNHGESEFLCSQGAGVVFTRFQQPTEWAVRYMLLRPVGWIFLVLGLFAALTSEVLDHLKRRSVGKAESPSRR